MEYNYSIKEGELLLNNSKRVKLIVWFTFLFRIVKLIFLLLSFCITAYLTYLIFEQCITDAKLINCIPLGSIFATFGSAVISVISLYCNKQISFFQENLLALHEQIPELSSWKRWPFLKRYSKERARMFWHSYHALRNPQITFNGQNRCLTIPLPTCTADFYDLPIAINIIKMKCFHKPFTQSVARHQNIQEQKDIFIFYCTLMIYKNIIKYKFGTFLMLIGSEFVLTSIIFSFLYQPIHEVLLPVTAYF